MNFTSFSGRCSLEAIAADPELALCTQQQLIRLGFLDPPADGKFGPLSAAALKDFQQAANCPEINCLGVDTVWALQNADVQDFAPKITPGKDLAGVIISHMLANSMRVFVGSQKYNIVYLEGVNEDGSLNNDEPNHFNDLRLVIEIPNAIPKVVGKWQATSEPGFYYTYNPMNPNGAARIAFGQYKAWSVGIHGHADPHEALIQTAPIKVHRDFNRDFKRTDDRIDEGLFGVNQHWGYDYPQNDIAHASAGCLVGRTRQGHREFMQFVKSDLRFIKSKSYIFYTTVLAGDKLWS